jgi:hypothetical protein
MELTQSLTQLQDLVAVVVTVEIMALAVQVVIHNQPQEVLQVVSKAEQQVQPLKATQVVQLAMVSLVQLILSVVEVVAQVLQVLLLMVVTDAPIL